ncbi:MAG: acetyl-CoA C-acyltransferase, partial [Bdellovibrionales bacterium]|nr:acetyl-CoA C-acyltransferase [Bdellovibrionales bacterium]
MKKVYVLSAVRTAIGNFGGALAACGPKYLGTCCAAEAIARAKVDKQQVDELVLGSVLGAGHGMNLSRQIAQALGLSDRASCFSINMVCGSGLQSICLAALQIQAGRSQCILAGGVESMSQAAYVSMDSRFGARMGSVELKDVMIADGLTDAMLGCHMGITAENIADDFGISREAQDAFALRSQQKARAAIDSGHYVNEIVPVPLMKRGVPTGEFSIDEYPRETSLEKLGALKPAFKKDGSVTAGNASGINDGAAFLMLASEDFVTTHGLKPMACLREWETAGVPPRVMGTGPIEAVKKLQVRSKVELADLDLIESNEAFAAQAIAVDQALGWDTGKVNIGGGAIALGHPIGAS